MYQIVFPFFPPYADICNEVNRVSQGILVNISVSDDKMEAYLDIIPGGGGPEEVDLAYLETFLDSQNIYYGIDGIALRECLAASQKKEACHRVLIARGQLPKKGSPAYIRLKERLFSPPKPQGEDADIIDFRLVSPFVMVKKGEPLGRKMEEAEGTEGINVFGEKVIPGKKDIVQIAPGENTEWIGEHKDVIAASTAGRFEFDGKTFSVSDTLEIQGNVDYSTGHISFAGDVIIQGEIRDGFRVAAGGAVYCKKTLDASEILCRKDLIIEGGIIGRQTGLVRVQGKVETRFIENCHVESFQGISVKSSVLDSELYTLGELILGEEKGTLIGGQVYAEKGITLKNLGSARNSHTLIFIGISYINMRKLNHLQKRLNVLSLKMNSLKKQPSTPEHLQLLEKADKAMAALQQGIARLMVEQYQNYEAEVRVSGSVYPGAVITICDRQMKLSEKMSEVCFYYDQKNSRIATKEYKKGS